MSIETTQPLQRPVKNTALSAHQAWWIGSLCVAALVTLPFIALLFEALRGSDNLFAHLWQNVIATALPQTLILLLGVALIAGSIGTLSAWLVSAYHFPMRRLLSWALLLPLAMPTYIVAYAYLDILHPIGPVQSAIRLLLGYDSPRDFRLPDIRSMFGCILLLGFVLFPYVYIPVRALFLTQSGNLLDAARMLGTSQRGLFLKVALPLARPAIAIGLSLALMEALNDIGASEFLGVRTLTVSVYTTWITRSDLPGAAQIALFMLLVVVALVWMERWARRNHAYAPSAQRFRSIEPIRLEGLSGVLATVLVGLPVLIGFVAPFSYIVIEAWKRFQFAGLSPKFLSEAVNTISFASLATVVTLLLGLVVSYCLRLRGDKSSMVAFRLASLGYAAPGTIVAIGILIALGSFDRNLDAFAKEWFSVSTGLLTIGTGAALLYAYVVRFLTISAGGIDAGLGRIPKSYDHAARMLGRGTGATLREVHLPLSKQAIIAAGLLIFVDCVKELPATLLLRPLNFETFATHLYGEAARGTYEEASIAALAIVLIAMVPVIFLGRVKY
jgi:iron(III) transport system permease protein